jgi:hypothetical protein
VRRRPLSAFVVGAEPNEKWPCLKMGAFTEDQLILITGASCLSCVTES